MTTVRRFLLRLVHFFQPHRAESELERELAAHLGVLEDEYKRRGLTDAEARLAALRAFGGVAQAKELHRDARSFRWLNDLRQDARFAARALLRAPGFTAVVVVSDANCILGRLAPGGLIGGRMQMDLAAARRAFNPVAEQLGMSIERAALGVLGIVTANMVGAIRTVSVERGNDPRDFSLMPFGGAGPLHAAEVARSLGMREIIVPRSPGILCALGLLVSDLKEDFVTTARVDLSAAGLQKVNQSLSALVAEATAWAEREGIDPARRYDELSLDMRFVGQNFELSVPIGRRMNGAQLKLPECEALKKLFFEAHDKAYGFHNADAPIEIVNVRLSAGSALSPIEIRHAGHGHAPVEPIGRQRVHFTETDCRDTLVYDRATFRPGLTLEGPAIIAQFDSTTVVFPGDRVTVDDSLSLIIEVQQ